MRLLLLLVVLATLPAPGKIMGSDLVDIPVERLLKNAQARAAKSPDDAQLQFALGRIFTLAYASQASVLPAQRHNEELEMSPLGNWPPSTVKTPVTASARQHLQGAIAAYRRAVALDPNQLGARLSYAWALQQDGQKNDAITQYRLVLKRAWPKEKSHEIAVFGKSLSREAAGYLLELLDPSRNAEEIERLQQIRAEAARIPRAMTPILLPLEAQTPFSSLVEPGSPVRFDLDGSGRARAWGWLTPKAAWLVFLERRSRVDSALQMFGSVSFLAFWANGYEALAALDEDGDGCLQGPELQGLALWHDSDENGVCDPNEIQSLSQAGIDGLFCSWIRREGYLESPTGVRYRDGRRGPSYDWIRY